jgi:hypothetical protein
LLITLELGLDRLILLVELFKRCFKILFLALVIFKLFLEAHQLEVLFLEFDLGLFLGLIHSLFNGFLVDHGSRDHGMCRFLVA